MSSLRQTPLTGIHRELGARLVEFAGFEMPVQYTGILAEHAAVRERAGLFDVSHMGQLHFSGTGAVAAVERLVSCPVSTLRVGRIRYGLLCNAEGGVVDDVTVYRVADDALFLCVNAANIGKDESWAREHGRPDAALDNRSDDTGLLALQGPESAPILDGVAAGSPSALRRFTFADFELAGRKALVSRTGYTGAPGFEIYVASRDTETVFRALLDAGSKSGLLPAGLGARDTLRLEAALPLYGHELDDTTSPLEAGLDRFVKRDAGGFIGAEAIEKRAAAGSTRRLVGFELVAPGVARAGYEICENGEPVGKVTSGAPSPTLQKSIGLGYVPPALSEIGTRFDVAIRNRQVAARVVETPFVGRG